MASKKVCLPCMFVVMLWSSFLPSLHAEELRLCSSDYEPYYGSQMADYGPIIKLAVLAFREEGYDVKVEFLPWNRVLRYGMSGRCDAIAAVWFSKERESWLALTDPIADNQIGLYKRKTDPLVFKDLLDLKEQGIMVGTVRGYANPESFTKAGILTEEVSQDSLNIKKLLSGHLQLVLIDKNLGRHLAAQDGKENDIEWLTLVETTPMYIGITINANPNWEKRRDDFNAGLATLKKKGIFRRLLKEYGVQ